MVAGAGPSARYAHTLALVANRFLVAVGGNDGKQTLADSWALDTSEKPYQWRKIPESGDDPPPRCSAGGWPACWWLAGCVRCRAPCKLLLRQALTQRAVCRRAAQNSCK